MEVLIGSGLNKLTLKKLNLSERFNRGNSLITHNIINSENFFSILKNENINLPNWTVKKPNSSNYLIKKFYSFGGNDIRNFKKEYSPGKLEYFQKKIKGEHISVQYFVYKKEIKILSICDQFFLNRDSRPYIIECIISKKEDLKLKRELLKICTSINNLFDLNGINNLDLVVESKTKKIFVIELNSRPGLSTNIIHRIYKNIYTKKPLRLKEINKDIFYATKIIYSKKKILIDKKKIIYLKSLQNKNIYSELPIEGQVIKKNGPICLIHLKSKKKQVLEDKLKNISHKILKKLE